MFDDEDDWDDNDDNISNLLEKFSLLKNGTYSAYLFSQDDFDAIIDFLSVEGKYKDALEAVEYALDIYPNTVELILKKVELLMDCNREKEAIKIVRFAKSLEPKNLEIVSLEIELLCALDQEDEATYMLQKMIQREEDRFLKTFFLQELVTVNVLQEKYKEAYLNLVKVLKEDDQNEEALHRIAFIARKSGKAKESIMLHQILSDKYPLNDLIWYNLADAYQQTDQLDEAEIAYDTVLGLDPKNESAYLGLTECYMLQKKYELAIKHIEEYNSYGLPDYFLNQTLAKCYIESKQYKKARQVYEQMPIQFEFVLEEQIYLAIAETYILEKDYIHALDYLEKAIKINNTNEETNRLLGLCYTELELWADAEKSMENAIVINEKNSSNYEDIICMFLYSENLPKALQYLDLSEELNIKSSKLNYLKVVTYILSGSHQAAEQALVDALDFSLDYSEILSSLIPEFEKYTRYTDIISMYK